MGRNIVHCCRVGGRGNNRSHVSCLEAVWGPLARRNQRRAPAFSSLSRCEAAGRTRALPIRRLTLRRVSNRRLVGASKGRAGERQGWRPVSVIGSTHWSGCSGCVWRNPEHRGAHTMRSPHRIRRGRDQTEASTAAASRTGKKARARDALSNHTGDMGNAAAPPLQHRLTLAGRHPSIRHTRTHTDMHVEHSV